MAKKLYAGEYFCVFAMFVLEQSNDRTKIACDFCMHLNAFPVPRFSTYISFAMLLLFAFGG
jgi:hypothetical protein